MRIAFLFDDSLDYPDGVQQYMLTLGEWYTSQGHEVHYVVSTTKRIDIKNVHVLVRNIGMPFNGNHVRTPLIVQKKKIKSLFQEYDFNVLHVQMPYSPFFVGRVIAHVPANVKVVGTFHIAPFGKITQLLSHLQKMAIRGTLQRFDAVCSVSTTAKAFARQTFGIESSVIPNAVKLSHFIQPRQQYKKNEGKITIAFLGRLVERKGCIWLLKAIKELSEKELNVKDRIRVQIGGSGVQAKLLKDYVTRHRIKDTVEFVGFIPEKDKPTFLANADIAVFPSLGGESFGIILVEAMATGRSVVLAGDNPGYKVVMNESKSHLFNPKNTTSLASLLKMYIERPEKRKARIVWQNSIAKQYDVNVVGKRLLQLYTNQ